MRRRLCVCGGERTEGLTSDDVGPEDISAHLDTKSHCTLDGFSGNLVGFLVILIALLAVAKCQAGADGHESEWGQEQHQHAAADGALPVFGSARSRAVAHGAALSERG